MRKTLIFNAFFVACLVLQAQMGNSFLKKPLKLIDISNNIENSTASPSKNREFSSNYSRFFEKKPHFIQLLQQQGLSEDDLRQILARKLHKNLTCEEIDEILRKSQILLDFLDDHSNFEIVQEFLVSLKIIKRLIKKVLEIEKADAQTRSKAYEKILEFFDQEKDGPSISLENETILLENNPEIASFYANLNEELENLFVMIVEQMDELGIFVKSDEILQIIKKIKKFVGKNVEQINTLEYLIHRKVYRLLRKKYKKCQKDEIFLVELPTFLRNSNK